jgi:hypothetical protein
MSIRSVSYDRSQFDLTEFRNDRVPGNTANMEITDMVDASGQLHCCPVGR